MLRKLDGNESAGRDSQSRGSQSLSPERYSSANQAPSMSRHAGSQVSIGDMALDDRFSQQTGFTTGGGRVILSSKLPTEMLEFQRNALSNLNLNKPNDYKSDFNQKRIQSKQQPKRPISIGLERLKYNRSLLQTGRADMASRNEGQRSSHYDEFGLV